MGRSSGRTKVCRDAQKLCLFDCNQSVYTTESRNCLSAVFTHRSYVAIRGLHTPELFSRGTHNEGKVGATDTCRGKLEGDPPTGGKKPSRGLQHNLVFRPFPKFKPFGYFSYPSFISSFSVISPGSQSLFSHIHSCHIFLLSHISLFVYLHPLLNPDVDLFQTFVDRCIY